MHLLWGELSSCIAGNCGSCLLFLNKSLADIYFLDEVYLCCDIPRMTIGLDANHKLESRFWLAEISWEWLIEKGFWASWVFTSSNVGVLYFVSETAHHWGGKSSTRHVDINKILKLKFPVDDVIHGYPETFSDPWPREYESDGEDSTLWRPWMLVWIIEGCGFN